MRAFALVWALIAIAACRRPQHLLEAIPEYGPGALDEGRASYQRACASCHGVDGRGHGPVAPTLKVPPPDLTTLAERHGGTYPEDFVIEVISGERLLAVHGTREMPVWSERFGSASGAEAAAALYARRRLELLAYYIRALQRTERGR